MSLHLHVGRGRSAADFAYPACVEKGLEGLLHHCLAYIRAPYQNLPLADASKLVIEYGLNSCGFACGVRDDFLYSRFKFPVSLDHYPA